jgi:hypothetical protein
MDDVVPTVVGEMLDGKPSDYLPGPYFNLAV